MDKGYKGRNNFPFVFLAPAIITLLITSIFPFLYTIYLSITDFYLLFPDQAEFIGLQNYWDFIKDPNFWRALFNTFCFSGGSVCIEIILGLVFMLLLCRRELPGRNVFRTLIILPMVATPIAVTYMWKIMFSPSLGILNYFLAPFHLKPLWIADPALAMISLILVDVWQWTPFVVLIMVSGFMSLPMEPYEAAIVDGANWWQIFWKITLPLLRPIFFIVLILRLIDSLKTFDIIYALTGGGPMQVTETLNIFIYQNAFRFLHIGYAAAASIGFLFITIYICMFLIKKSNIEVIDS